MYLLLTLPLVEMIPVLQTAIGPMILISGVGMLLLNMTNRLGRTIDRSRQLLAKLKESDEEDRRRNKLQLDILWRRAHLLQTAIALIATSALLAALLVIVLFISALLKVESAILLSALFMLCLGALIVALVYFLRDINLTLHALALELGREDQPRVPLTLAPTGRATRGNDSSTTE
jgi:Cu/Ag efflux pump CusA